MKKLHKIFFWIIFLVHPFFVQGQIYKADVPVKFDRINYYSDSTVSVIACTRKGELHGYSIEFDRYGDPKGIGKYKKGKRKGTWIYQDGTTIVHKKKGTTRYDPPFCGTIKMDPRYNRSFYRLYDKLFTKNKP